MKIVKDLYISIIPDEGNKLLLDGEQVEYEICTPLNFDLSRVEEKSIEELIKLEVQEE